MTAIRFQADADLRQAIVREIWTFARFIFSQLSKAKSDRIHGFQLGAIAFQKSLGFWRSPSSSW
jgi:hypothetical protein